MMEYNTGHIYNNGIHNIGIIEYITLGYESCLTGKGRIVFGLSLQI
jgi:hypothetical protein